MEYSPPEEFFKRMRLRRNALRVFELTGFLVASRIAATK